MNKREQARLRDAVTITSREPGLVVAHFYAKLGSMTEQLIADSPSNDSGKLMT